MDLRQDSRRTPTASTETQTTGGRTAAPGGPHTSGKPPFSPSFLGPFVPVAQPGWGSRDKCTSPFVPVVLRTGMNGSSTWPLRAGPWPGPFVPVRNTNRDECPLCRGSIWAISLPQQRISFYFFLCIVFLLGFRVYCIRFYFMFFIYIAKMQHCFI